VAHPYGEKSMADEIDEVMDGYAADDADAAGGGPGEEKPPVVGKRDPGAKSGPAPEPEGREAEAGGGDPIIEMPTLHDSGNCNPMPTTSVIVNAMGDEEAQAAANLPEASEIKKALANPAANDKLVETVRRDDSTLGILNVVMEEIAEEAAYLKAWRNAVWNGETDISDSTLSRIKMLKNLVDTLVEREKMKREKAVGKVDFHSENFQQVLKFFMQVINKTFNKVKIPPQYEDIFFTQLAKDFDGFEKKAEKIYYGKK